MAEIALLVAIGATVALVVRPKQAKPKRARWRRKAARR